jgi:two-component sensor histidine kinase/PAS domain-containing protein
MQDRLVQQVIQEMQDRLVQRVILETQDRLVQQVILEMQDRLVQQVIQEKQDRLVQRAILETQDVESLIAVPVIFEGAFQGLLGLDNPTTSSAATLEDLATPLRVFSEVIAGVLQRAAGERELRALHLRISGRVAEQRAMLRMSADLAATRSRDGFYGILGQHLGDALPAANLTLMTLSQGGRTVRIRPLVTLANLQTGPYRASLEARSSALEVDTESLAGRSEWQALVRGETVSTEGGTAVPFPDLIDQDARQESSHFVVVPLIGPDGVLGCFKARFSGEQPLLPQTTDWVEQVGALLGAHIAAHEAREALQDLNANLEARVASRSAAFQASEERFTTLFDRAPQAMLLLDHAGLVTRSNARARALFRIGEDAPADLSFHALLPEHGAGAGAPTLVAAQRLDGTSFQAETSLVTVYQEGRPFDIVGVADVTERIEAQDAIVRSLQEKETLIKEIHHRVKNNLQIISSLLMLQSDRMPSDAGREFLAESVLQVRSMALIHEQLYGVESLDRIDLGEYARTLAQGLCATLAPTVRVRVDAGVTDITINEAIPLGLILNELLTNAFKYGLPFGPRTGDWDVRVVVGSEDDRVRLEVCDRGPGLPGSFDPERSQSLGLHLVRSLTRQLRGHLSWTNTRAGACLSFTCPRVLA